MENKDSLVEKVLTILDDDIASEFKKIEGEYFVENAAIIQIARNLKELVTILKDNRNQRCNDQKAGQNG
jgi:hypothetical protein